MQDGAFEFELDIRREEELSQRLIELCDSFRSCTSLQSLLTNFVDFLHNKVHVRRTQCFSFSVRGSRCTFNDYFAKIDSLRSQVDGYSSSEIGEMKVLLAEIVKNGEMNLNPIELILNDSSINAVLAAKTKKGGVIVVWDTVPKSMNQVISLGVRMVQQEARWYQKLDNTQALLYIDDLTGLFNYRYLDVALESELRRASRYQNSFSLLFIDLDDFKKINDQHGHLVGSRLLREFGQVLNEELREVDAVIRYGGDEYVILLIGTDTEAGVMVAERIRKQAQEKVFEIDQRRISLTCSIGVASYPEHGKAKETLLKYADETMYQSKRQGKNLVMVFTPGQAKQGKNTSIE